MFLVFSNLKCSETVTSIEYVQCILIEIFDICTIRVRSCLVVHPDQEAKHSNNNNNSIIIILP